jgi:hypothetical protein
LGFGLAEHREAGHANLIDRFGLWWTITSIGLLGLLVALQPITNYEWRKCRKSGADESSGSGRRHRGLAQPKLDSGRSAQMQVVGLFS